jgi:hypothetical protein
MHHQIKADGGNCMRLDSTNLLQAKLTAESDESLSISEVAQARKYNLTADCSDDVDKLPDIQGAAQFISSSTSSEYRSAVVTYIAGFVCRMVKKQIKCARCCHALSDGEHQVHPFIRQKDKGGLIKPSPDTVAVCTETDQNIRRILITTRNKLPQGPGVPFAIATAVLA